MATLFAHGAYVWGHDSTADVLIRDGVIDAVGELDPAADAETLDLTGQVLMPSFVEAHCHLDKTLFGGRWVPHSAGDALAERIANDRDRRRELGIPSVDRIAALLQQMASYGTTHARTHTDVDPDVGLRGIEAVREAATRVGTVSVHQVAFPQHGVLATPGTEALLSAAAGAGVEAIGGIDPAGMDGDPVRHLDIVFGIAERHGLSLDIHLHDGGTLGAWELELIAERTKALSLAGRVAVSHAYAFGDLTDQHRDSIVERIAEAGVSIVTGAVYSFPVPPVKTLRAAGANVACGHDGIRDLWGPYGSGDMLERAMHLAYRSTFRRDADIELALEAVTLGGRRLLGFDDRGIVPGAPADLVAVPADTPAEAVVTHPAERTIVRAGRVVTAA
ncbi:amidohydrolase [Solicola gregarius]|uniref:Amidohydrolase n=1 Tax=Solicola gregarius TaxID=2908642 RepID=A0AA46TG15_9ACTN|nr:amidohydrolase [Solicola gregarius]UYM04142.1 amidohydrolase [Solicola gregarius]